MLGDVGDLAGSAAAYREAVRLATHDGRSQNDLGGACDGPATGPAPRPASGRRYGCDPKDAVAHCNLGIELRDAKDLPGAVAAFRK